MMKPLHFLFYKNINDVAYYVLLPNFLSFLFWKFLKKPRNRTNNKNLKKCVLDVYAKFSVWFPKNLNFFKKSTFKCF
jgi:hypothetical protein